MGLKVDRKRTVNCCAWPVAEARTGAVGRDNDGSIWVKSSRGALRFGKDGDMECYTFSELAEGCVMFSEDDAIEVTITIRE